MNQSKISVRYARALFLLALEKNKLDEVYQDVLLVDQVMKDFGLFGLYLKSPIVKPSQKLNVIREVFTNKVNDISLRFLYLLVRNKRDGHLEDIIRRFFDVFREHKGIKSAIVTTAIPLADAMKAKLHTLLANIYNTEIDLKSRQDASIIGGLVLQVGDQQYDASVATGLKNMKTALLKENLK